MIKNSEGYKQGANFGSDVRIRRTEFVSEDLIRYRYFTIINDDNNDETEVVDGTMHLAARLGARIRPCLDEILKMLDKPENASITHAKFEFNGIDIKVKHGDDIHDLISWYEDVYNFKKKMEKVANHDQEKSVGV